MCPIRSATDCALWSRCCPQSASPHRRVWGHYNRNHDEFPQSL